MSASCMAKVRGRAGLSLVILVLILAHGAMAYAQQVSISATREIYAGLPFTLNVAAEGFAKDPQPDVSDFDIAGAKVTFIGVSPNISTSISIINGRRSESQRVQYVYRYRVVPDKPGNYRIPAITVTQGTTRASSQPAAFLARDVATTPNMHIDLELPDRPVSVGETFDVAINWYLRAEVNDVDMVVPLFDEPLWIDVHQPQISTYQRRTALSFPAGDREIELPYTRDQVTVDGAEYTRLRFEAAVTAIKAGTLEVEPTRVMASLKVGEGRDAFGFRTARTKLFKAEDVPRTLQVKPLPASGRPPSFANAVGTAYSIQVQARRTVVKLGDPVELEIVIRGDGRLEGLSLPPLDNQDGLPADKFTVSDTPATGEIIDLDSDSEGKSSGKAKRFLATVRVKSPEVREIPAIAFSYFNPKTGRYDTVHSQPIALSVEGSSIVGAGDVVSAVKSPAHQPEATDSAGRSTGGTFVGADLSLSPRSATLDRPWTVASIKPFLFALYLVPLLVLGFRLWQVNTRARRDKSSETRSTLREVHRQLDRAQKTPAREAAPQLLAALRALATVTGRKEIRDESVIARIENESYNPNAANEPLGKETLGQARDLAAQLMDEWQRSTKAAQKARFAAMMLVPWLVVGSALAGRAPAHAADPYIVAQVQSDTPAQVPPAAPVQATNAGSPAGPAQDMGAGITIDAARAAYQEALARSDRTARSNGFARAERMFRELVQTHPGHPELLTDWGNAALGAQDLGRATLAYRRALALQPGQARAASNLSEVRKRAPDWLPVPAVGESLGESLQFWKYTLSRPARHLIGALAFCATIVLLMPWSRRQQRLLRWLAVPPALLWLAMVASLVYEKPPVDDAVIIADSVPMLSADSPGAPPALANPLPAGAEVSIIETRAPWTQIALADGTKGWVQASSVEPVLRPEPTR